VPADLPTEREEFRWLLERFPPVYDDGEVLVLTNPRALPRAWIVHDAIQVAPGEALPLLASSAVDPRRTAIVEEELPPMAQPGDPAADRAFVGERGPDRLRLTVQTGAAGLLVLSEIYDPGWRAFVDGRSVPLLVADHILRAVAVPAGTHVVELRYETPALLVGSAISLATIAVLLTSAVLVDRRRRRLVG
jgi:Bacterial membrane protein YfhO